MPYGLLIAAPPLRLTCRRRQRPDALILPKSRNPDRAGLQEIIATDTTTKLQDSFAPILPSECHADNLADMFLVT